MSSTVIFIVQLERNHIKMLDILMNSWSQIKQHRERIIAAIICQFNINKLNINPIYINKINKRLRINEIRYKFHNLKRFVNNLFKKLVIWSHQERMYLIFSLNISDF